ncbi:MAG: transcription termination/antitermination protein NusG [Hyphomicrobiaceae bacterium]
MWLVVNAQPGREGFAIENLERQEFSVYCPMVLKRIRHARRAYDAKRPLFPGYLFVEHQPDLKRWRPILGTYGVRSVVRNGETPSLLDGDFIAALRAREVGGVIAKPESPFSIGDMIAIRGGAFDGLVGEIIAMREKDRAVVLLNLLNQQVKAQVSVDALRLADVR